MKMSRRGILAGLLVAGSMPAHAAPIVDCQKVTDAPIVPPPNPGVPKGYILPRISHRVVPMFPHQAFSPQHAVCVIDYEVFDGEQWVALESEKAQRVIAELRGDAE